MAADLCKIKAGNLVFELELTDDQSMFEKLHHIQEIFDQSCGKCKSTNIRYVVREVDENKYYECRCTDCFARLSFGCNKKGKTIFPKRKDDQGNYLPDSGWVRWNREKGVAE